MSRHVERLRPDHDRSGFSCGREELDNWFKAIAGQAERKSGSARVYVLIDEEIGDGRVPIAFYALTAHSVEFEPTPEAVRKRQSPHLPIGAVLLGQLAVDADHQEEGIGTMLLKDVLEHVLAADQHVGVPLLVVDAIDEAAAGWYEGFGFKRFTDDPMRLAIRLIDARLTFGLD